MTANRRIFFNIVATYGRSLYALAIGLFCGRWTLMALGQVDLGLMSVVGGLTASRRMCDNSKIFHLRLYAMKEAA